MSIDSRVHVAAGALGLVKPKGVRLFWNTSEVLCFQWYNAHGMIRQRANGGHMMPVRR